MKDLKFNVYIGEDIVEGQHRSDIVIENVVAVVCPQFLVPHGKLNLSGKLYSPQLDCFWSIYQLAKYFCDWLDIVEDKNRIVADIHLNISSLHKAFRGDNIIKIIDKIDANKNYRFLRTFDF